MRSTAEVQKSIQRIIDKEIAITQKEKKNTNKR